jgi:hypothetical protein
MTVVRPMINIVGRSSKNRDFMTICRRVVEQAIGEKLNGEPLDGPEQPKDAAAVASGDAGEQKAARRGPTA